MVNRATLVGRVGRDPELRFTADGTPVASFSMAMTEIYKRKDGTKADDTTWLDIVVWRKLAEIVGEYVKKGALLYVEGKIQVQKYEDREGVKRQKIQVVADQMKMLGSKGSGQQRTDDPDFPTEEDDIPL